MRNIFIISVDEKSGKLLVKCRWNRTMPYVTEWYTAKNVWEIVQALVGIINNFASKRYAKEPDNAAE